MCIRDSLEIGRLDAAVHVDVDAPHLVHLVGELDAAALTHPPKGLVAADRVEPRPEEARVAQLVEVLRRREEGVVEGVGRLVAITQDAVAVVVQLVRVAVVDGRSSGRVAAPGGLNQRCIVHGSHT